jgi:hypothetical protein
MAYITNKKELPMIDKLKVRFTGAIDNARECREPNLFVWFQDKAGNTIGIPKSDISAEEIDLLQLLFPMEANEAEADWNATFQKKQWSDFLYNNSGTIPLTSWKEIRYTHFTVSNIDFVLADFEEAFLSFMNAGALIIWENDLTGILIEGESGENHDKNELSSVLNTLESDFYIKLRTFMGSFHQADNNLPIHLQMERKLFRLAKQYLPDMNMTDLPYVFPYAVMAGMEESDTDWYIRQLLRNTKNDNELISSVKMYIECSSNASLAAKQLYIHRNSLQYRIDKFIERTGLDIRSFRHSLTAYLIILLNK